MKKTNKTLKNKYICKNKKVQYKYLVEKTIESGISLLGWEVKSARKKKLISKIAM